VSREDGGAEERPAEAEPGSGASGSEAEPGSETPSRTRHSLRSPPALYFAGFSVVLLSFAALALGGLALLGRGIGASPTGFFWASIVLSVAALGLALAALFAPRRR
jgi:hypothetical protein